MVIILKNYRRAHKVGLFISSIRLIFDPSFCPFSTLSPSWFRSSSRPIWHGWLLIIGSARGSLRRGCSLIAGSFAWLTRVFWLGKERGTLAFDHLDEFFVGVAF